MSVELPVLEQPQQAEGSVWSYVSPSRLSLWLRCPLSFRLRYLEGIKTPTTPSLFVGKLCHAVLEVHYRHQMLGVTLSPEDVIARMDATWAEAVDEEGMRFESAAEEAGLKTQAARLVAAYLKQVPSDEPRPSGVEVRMEAPLVDLVSGEDLGIPLLGIVDLLLDTEEAARVIDFKTSSRSSPPFEVTHEVQLSSYAWLYRQLTGRIESGLEIRSLIKTKTPKVEVHAYPARTEQHFRRLFGVIREYLDALDAGRFNFRPGWGCGMCEFRDTHCRRWEG